MSCIQCRDTGYVSNSKCGTSKLPCPRECWKANYQNSNTYLNERVSQLTYELAEAKEQIEAYQVRVDNDALRMDATERTKDSLMRECAERDELRVEIAADLLRDMAKARSREANLAHPLTADRFSQVLDAD